MVAPLIRLTQKDQPFSWGVEAKNAFQSLKVFFTTAPFLIHVDPMKPFLLEMNTFDFALNIVLPQYGKNNLLNHVNFHFCKFSSVNINYEIHDKDFFATMDVFEGCHHLLKIAQHGIIVYLDHKNF
jgi:hypothetical protein